MFWQSFISRRTLPVTRHSFTKILIKRGTIHAQCRERWIRIDSRGEHEQHLLEREENQKETEERAIGELRISSSLDQPVLDSSLSELVMFFSQKDNLVPHYLGFIMVILDINTYLNKFIS